jgi:hypothetical protein
MKLGESIASLAQAPSQASASFRFTLEQGAWAAQSFAATLHICSSPSCGCAHVGFECQSLSAADAPVPGTAAVPAPLRFDLDVFERAVSPQTGESPAAAALARAVAAELQAADWEMLGAFLLATKRRQMETMDLDTLEAHFPPAVIDEGAMVGYLEVFPWAESLRFTLGAERWLVDDQYCVQPGCPCAEAALAFFRLREDAARAHAPAKCAVFVRHEYMNGKTRVEEAKPGSPAAGALMQALRVAHPGFGETLRQRHEQLKQLGRRLIPKSGCRSQRPGPYPVGDDMDSVAEDRLPQPPVARIERAPPRPGRNDPCPCGSGKKFKKCCGSSSSSAAGAKP